MIFFGDGTELSPSLTSLITIIFSQLNEETLVVYSASYLYYHRLKGNRNIYKTHMHSL
jgi:hypothetical protein